MTMLLGVFLALAIVGGLVLLVLWLIEQARLTRLRQESEGFRVAAEAQRMESERSLAKLQAQVERLSKWSHVADADDFGSGAPMILSISIKRRVTVASGFVLASRRLRRWS